MPLRVVKSTKMPSDTVNSEPRSRLQGLPQHLAAWVLAAGGSLVAFREANPAAMRLTLGIALAASAMAALSTFVGNHGRRLVRGVYWVFALPILAVLAVHGVYVSQRGNIGEDELRAIAQSNPSEAFHYLATLATPNHLLFIVACLSLIVLTFPAAARNGKPRSFAWLAVSVTLLTATLVIRLDGQGYIGPMHQYIAKYRSEAALFQELLQKRRTKPIIGAHTSFKGNLVVVIGESTTRHHMGVYGYFRDTTPFLSSVRSNLLVFDDVISSHSHTVPALISAFSSTGSSEENAFYEPESMDIVSLARGAGLETYWLSNQNEYGIWDNPVSLIGKASGHVQFFSTSVGKSLLRTTPDGDMLPRIRELLSDSTSHGRLIMVHLFATHTPYCVDHFDAVAAFAVPLDRSFFGRKPVRGVVNCYDNGIRYVDWFLSKVIRASMGAKDPTAVVYFSDHGEAPLLGTGHESSRHSSYHIEIPFIVTANPRFRDSRADFWSEATANQSQPYSTARLYHSLAHLMEIKHASVRHADSLFSGDLEAKERVALHGKIKYDQWSPSNDYRENSRITIRETGKLNHRVWAHRINSIGALLEAKQIFAGVEMDVIFAASCRCFRVYHPPAPDTGLTLDAMLAAAQNRPQLMLWLDWKNATTTNVADAMRALAQLDKQYSIRSRTLVETGSDATFPEIADISVAGFRHGYYLPTERIRHALSRGSPEELEALASEIAAVIGQGSFDAVTFDWRLQPFVSRWLAATVRTRELDLFSWDMSIDASGGQRDAASIRARFKKLDIAALLVTFPSDFRI